jgi:hypothetical protein
MSLAIDGYISGSASPNSSTYTGVLQTGTLTTTNTNDIILVFISNEYPNQTPTSVSSVTGGGLTFINRWKYNNTGMAGNSSQNMELWWAQASSTFSSQISVNFNSGYTDDADVIAFGVSGTNFNNPWDQNSSLPSKLTYNNAIGAISTNTNNTMVLSFYATPGTNNSTIMHPVSPTPSGSQQLTYVDNFGAQWFELAYVAYGINTTKQSNVVWGWSSLSPGSTSGAYSTSNSNFYVVLDVLTADSPININGNFLTF